MVARASKFPTPKRRTRGGKVYIYARFNGTEVSFGRADDPRTLTDFDSYVARWLSNGRQLDDDNPADGLSVRELADQWQEELAGHNLQPRSWDRIRGAMRALTRLYGSELAINFGPRKLKLVRASMVASCKLCRQEINGRIRYVRECFSYGVAEELIPETVASALDWVPALRKGQYELREEEVVLDPGLGGIKVKTPDPRGVTNTAHERQKFRSRLSLYGGGGEIFDCGLGAIAPWGTGISTSHTLSYFEVFPGLARELCTLHKNSGWCYVGHRRGDEVKVGMSIDPISRLRGQSLRPALLTFSLDVEFHELLLLTRFRDLAGKPVRGRETFRAGLDVLRTVLRERLIMSFHGCQAFVIANWFGQPWSYGQLREALERGARHQ